MSSAWLLLNIVYASSHGNITKEFTTHDGLKYVYDYIPAKGNNETVLLMHGFPSTRRDWRNQIAGLSAAGFGVILPDQLGFGESDRPLEVEAYGRKRVAGHITELLDNEGLSTVVGAGHDWGSLVLASLAVWHPERFNKFIYLSVGYFPPGLPWDMDAPNKQSLEQLGFMKFGYWYFFNSWDAGRIAEQHVCAPSHSLEHC
jgi:pimeloyl-ACP methyl ester carboxylesterase